MSTGSFWSLDGKAFRQFRQFFVNANPVATVSHRTRSGSGGDDGEPSNPIRLTDVGGAYFSALEMGP